MPRSLVALLTLLVALGGLGSTSATAEDTADFIRAHYTKTEHHVPMRDGTRLFTAVYTPNDLDGSWPILLRRTPYGSGPYGVSRYRDSLGPTEAYPREKFIFVVQDVRGRMMSEGTFVNMRPHRAEHDGPEDVDESTDTYDTIEWLLENLEGHNGRVGMWGISYPGFYASAGMIDHHPALRAVSPQAPIADWWFDDMHHHGATALNLVFNFFSRFGVARDEPTSEWPPRFEFPTADAYAFYLDLGPLSNVNERHFDGAISFWNETVAHPNYDEFWQSRNILPHLRGIRTAVLVVGGLYDAEDLYGPLHTYRHANEQNPKADVKLVMGPWSHGAWTRSEGRRLGTADFGFSTSAWYQEQVELPFFLHHLKDAPAADLPEALVFETGADRWRRFEQWPPAELRERRLHLGADEHLSFEAVPEEGADAFLSDPDHPVPYTQKITTGWEKTYMTEDQRFAWRRPDVLTWRSEVLEEDLTLAGPITAELFVSTTGEDADWVVKLIDEYPPLHPDAEDDPALEPLGGKMEMVRSEIFRGRFRESYERPLPFTPGEITRVDVPLQDVCHTFQRGHRIVVQVQSTFFPLFDRNPQSWVENIFEATEEDFTAATHRVHRGPAHPSALRVGVLESVTGP